MAKNGRPFCGTRVNDSTLALRSPRIDVVASGTVSGAGHALLQTSLDGRASGGQRALPPCIPTRGTPWTPVGSRKGLSNRFLDYEEVSRAQASSDATKS